MPTASTPRKMLTVKPRPMSDWRFMLQLLRHRVAPRRLAEPRGAQLGCPLQRLEVHVDQPEAVAVAINPFEVVLCAPEEVSIHRDAIGGRALKLREVGAQEHDSIGV